MTIRGNHRARRGAAFVLAVLITTSSAGDPLDVDTSGTEPAVAAAIHAAVVAVRVNQRQAASWGHLGQLFHVHGMHVLALTSYSNARRLDPRDYRWPYLAALATPPEAAEAALALMAEAYALRPDDYALAIGYGDLLTRLGHLTRARIVYRAARPIDPRGYADLGLARLAHAEGRVFHARARLFDARRKSPRNGEIHRLLAQTFHRIGDREGARESAVRAEAFAGRLQPTSVVVDEMRSRAESVDTLWDLGSRLLARGEYASARLAFERARDRSKHAGSRFHRALADVALAERDWSRAAALLQSGLSVRPNDPELTIRLARVHLQSGDAPAAREAFERVLARDPDHVEARLGLARSDASQGQHSRAIGHFERALARDPTRHTALGELASAYEAEGDPHTALPHRERLRTIDPDDTKNLRSLAHLQEIAGEDDAAVATLRDALTRAPNDSRTTFELAWLLATRSGATADDAREAVELAQTVYRQNRRDPRYAHLMSAAYAANGDRKRALRTGKRALKLAKGNADLEAAISDHLDALNAR